MVTKHFNLLLLNLYLIRVSLGIMVRLCLSNLGDQDSSYENSLYLLLGINHVH